jgi:transcriptional regulator with XRE-family HTH domain
MTGNAYLYQLRKEKGLKLKEAAKGAKVSFITLYLYERGYLPISSNDLSDIAAFYGVESASLLDNLGYPTPIEDRGEAEDKGSKLDKFKKGLMSWPSIIAFFAVAATCVSLFGVGIHDVQEVNNNPSRFYDSNILDLVSYVNKNGEAVEQTGEDGTTKTYRGVEYKEGTTNLIDVLTRDGSNDWLGFQSVFSLGDNQLIFAFQDDSATRIEVTFGEYGLSSAEMTYTGKAYYDNGEYVVESLTDSNQKAIEDQSVISAKQALVKDYPSKNETLFEGLTKQVGLAQGVAFHDLLQSQVNGNADKAPLLRMGNNFILAFSLSGATFVFVSFLLLVLRLTKKRHKETIAEIKIESSPFEEVKPLEKNMSLQPYIPETALRMIVLVLVLICSIVIFQLTAVIDGISFTSFKDIAAILSDAFKNKSELLALARIWPLIPVATLLWFFVRIEIMQARGNIVPQILMFFFFGILYYVAEYSFSFYWASSSDIYHYYLMMLFTAFMPGNMFWGICCFSLIVLFLLTTPAGIKSKPARICWRLLAILPAGYLLLSYFYSVGTSLWGWATWPSYAADLLYRKQLTPTLFAISYPLCLYFYRRHINKKYGPENAAIYASGNRYYFMKNIFAASIIAVIALLNAAMQGNALAGTLDMKKSYWIAILIPLVLFYHPHVGKRNTIFDLAFALTYAAFFSFGYVYLARVVLFM